MNTIPTVISVSKEGIETMDLISNRFIKNNEIYIFDDITDELACLVISKIAYLVEYSEGDDIKIWINSHGGSVYAGLSIYDAIKRAQNKKNVITVCTGIAASMGAFLLAAGTKRFATPEAEILIHQPLGGGIHGQTSDVELDTMHLIRTKKRLNYIWAQNTGKTYEEIELSCERNYWLLPEEAITFGIIDDIYR